MNNFSDCFFNTGDMRCNCSHYLTIFGTNTDCGTHKNCIYKEASIFKHCLIEIYNLKMSKRDINKTIEKCFGEIQQLRLLVKKKIKIVKDNTK